MTKLIKKFELKSHDITKAIATHILNSPALKKELEEKHIVASDVNVRVEVNVYAPFLKNTKIDDMGVIVEVFED